MIILIVIMLMMSAGTASPSSGEILAHIMSSIHLHRILNYNNNNNHYDGIINTIIIQTICCEGA